MSLVVDESAAELDQNLVGRVVRIETNNGNRVTYGKVLGFELNRMGAIPTAFISLESGKTLVITTDDPNRPFKVTTFRAPRYAKELANEQRHR